MMLNCGIDNIKAAESLLKGAKIGLITNPTGLDKNFKSTIDILNEDYQLVCMFSPEHGVRGDLQAGDHVESYTDSKTNLPVYSLYGTSPHIKSEIMDTIDIIVFDIQDVGARFYTYLYTLAYAMQDCKKAGKRVVVLDRINPISANKVEGTVLDKNFTSFVGRFPIATRYSLTIGEYANYINDTQDIHCDLTVVKCTGYNRSLYFDETGLTFVSPSPNLPTIDSCICYIGTCLFEGTNLSEGRGTTKPFELIGAPFLNAKAVIAEMSQVPHEGVLLRETYFTPSFSKYQSTLCSGIALHITDKNVFEPFKLGVRLLDIIRKTHSEFEFIKPLKEGGKPFIDLLLGTDEIRSNQFDPETFFAANEVALKAYQEKIKKYYLYE
ncbi:MAG: DUF1343 domain-containing protein [Oscillospiraceae bacterium]